MGSFTVIPFVLLAVIPAACSLAVVILALTRWRSSVAQLLLSIVALGYGLVFFYLISQIAADAPILRVYSLPALVGALGLFVWFRSRRGSPRT